MSHGDFISAPNPIFPNDEKAYDGHNSDMNRRYLVTFGVGITILFRIDALAGCNLAGFLLPIIYLRSFGKGKIRISYIGIHTEYMYKVSYGYDRYEYDTLCHERRHYSVLSLNPRGKLINQLDC